MASSPDYDLSPDELNELLSAVMPEIPGYRVMRLLGRGGMSFVYLGVQESLDRPVAIKVIRPDALKDEVSKLRFEKEARTIAKLQHPCIVGIHEVGRTDQGLLYYVMPYLSKGHLGQRPVTRDQPWIISVLHALLWALDYAHLRGMVHRDVKPENVLFDNADRPVLTDFGIALNRRERARITGSGLALGSGDYMAPEQARGEVVDGRADLYSLGVLTYELLAGELPYVHDEPLSQALMHAMDPIPRLPAELEHWQAFIDKAMAKSRDQRFADAQEMMAALEQVEADVTRRARRSATGEQAAQKLSTPESKLAMPRLPWGKPAALASVVVLLAVLAILWGLRTDRPVPSPTASEQPDSAPNPTEPASNSAAPGSPPASDTAATPGQRAEIDDPRSVTALDRRDAEAGPADDASATDSDEAVEDALAEAPELPVEPPGVRALSAARRQIGQYRLTQPPGDNALQSLLDAQRLAPTTPGLAAAGELWLDTATPFFERALSEGREDAARALYQNAKRLIDALQLRQSAAWRNFNEAAAGPFRARLVAALKASDVDAIAQIRRAVQAMDIDPAALEPLWSQPVLIARPGDRLRGGTSMVLARLPEGAQAGLAMMPHAVTRDAYAAFLKASGHVPAGCRIRTALMTLKRRSWNSPGFEQQGAHPVVCVSPADAAAYASWLSQRDGARYRLPSAREWRAFVDLKGAREACSTGRIRCGDKGTQPADAGAGTAPGLRAMHGNVREWPDGCGPGCREVNPLGISWRDLQPVNKEADSVDARFGYDDIGFRLVREFAREDIERR